jgi:hypothetical protein
MKEPDKYNKLNQHGRMTGEENNLPGYPTYPSNEDIYGKLQKDRNINPEDPLTIKEPFSKITAGTNNEKDFNDDVTGSDLDIPGSELDDDLELIGSEDEENNYYSLGGDDHTDLDEDNLELNT